MAAKAKKKRESTLSDWKSLAAAIPLARDFSDPIATMQALLDRCSDDPDPLERKRAAARALELFGQYVKERNVGPVEGVKRKKKTRDERHSLIRDVAAKLREHGVPEKGLVNAIRDAVREKKLLDPVPAESTVRRALRGQI